MEWELEFLRWISMNLHDSFTAGLFSMITLLGNAGAVWLMMAAYFRFGRKRTSAAFLILCALAVSSLLTDGLLKWIVRRPRPFILAADITPLLHPKSYSFPSGHSATSFACAAMIGKLDKKLGPAALVIASLIAVSRLVLCVHYPTDVLFGALFGEIVGRLIYFWTKRRGYQ